LKEELESSSNQTFKPSNLQTFKLSNNQTIKNGYKQLEIRSPREFIKYESD